MVCTCRGKRTVSDRIGGQLDGTSLKIYVTIAQFLPDDDVRCNDDAYFHFPWKRRAGITSTRVELVFSFDFDRAFAMHASEDGREI